MVLGKVTCNEDKGDALRDLEPFVLFKEVKNTHGKVLLFVKLQALACNITKSNTHP